MSIRRILVQQLGSVLRLPLADLDKLGEPFGSARFDGVERIYLNTGNRDRQIFAPMRGTCHMESVRDYQVSKVAASWGCVCSECGGFHEFTDGKGWRFCPSCGAEVTHT